MQQVNVHPDIDNLCRQMYQTGRRWALMLPTEARANKVIMAHWLNLHTSQPVGGVGLLVAPAASLHEWYRAGWRGPVLGTGQFLKHPLPEPGGPRVVSAVFPELPAYSPAYLKKMDEFLKVDGDFCIIQVPVQPDDHPGLDVLMGTHGFKPIKVNLT